ncbi:MAG: hypothetical protein LQ342_003915 [Letrouitia transgressa]|nr:MAG: hypothetical protein LQ342_003915 [Letrouitia transgressa]
MVRSTSGDDGDDVKPSLSQAQRPEGMLGLPDRGQGLSNAIADAAKLCKALEGHVRGGKPIDEVLTAYENEVVERGQKAVVSSYENSMMVTDWEQVKESAIFKMGILKDKK